MILNDSGAHPTALAFKQILNTISGTTLVPMQTGNLRLPSGSLIKQTDGYAHFKCMGTACDKLLVPDKLFACIVFPSDESIQYDQPRGFCVVSCHELYGSSRHSARDLMKSSSGSSRTTVKSRLNIDLVLAHGGSTLSISLG